MSQISTLFGNFTNDRHNYDVRDFGGHGHSVRHTFAVVNKDVEGSPVVDSVDIQGTNNKETEQRVRALLKRTGFKEVEPA